MFFINKSMRRIFYIIILLVVLVLVPFGIQQLIQYRQLPNTITIATGKEGGRYKVIAEAIGQKIESEYGIKVEYLKTLGAQDNIKLIQSVNNVVL